MSSGRAVSVANGGVAAVLVGLLAGVALVVNPPAPPGIAEFAPRAAKPITHAPAEQGLLSGHGPGSCLLIQPCTAGSPAPRPTPVPSTLAGGADAGVPSALQCFTWPDGSVTQTFDPQSPPCIATWPEAVKGNGGATTKGVTGSEIRIAVPREYATATERVGSAYERFFNGHFQLYGRKLRLVYSEAAGRAKGTPQGQRAAAGAIRALRPFAALQLNGYTASDAKPYEDNLIAGKVITVRHDTLESSQPQRSSYFWTFNPQMEDVERNLASFLCGSLRPGSPARYGGGAEAAKARRFGVLQPTYADGRSSPRVDALVDGLAACGGKPEVAQVEYQPWDPRQANTHYQPVLLDLRNKGVTSLVVFDGASWSQLTDAMTAASSLGYQPEWVEPGLSYVASASNMTFAPKEQLNHLLGITSESKALTRALDPSLQAYQAVHPDEDPADLVSVTGARALYHQLQLLAAGVQAAGPSLTPASFESALQELAFPNPGAAAAPSYQATVGFGDGRTMVRDYSVWSWTSARRDLDSSSSSSSPPGTRCAAERGKRWSLGSWPTTAIPLFEPTPQC